MISLPNNFFMEFAGISSYQPALQGTLTHADFINRQASDGTNPSAGDGNYRLNPTSPLIGLPVDLVLPYDLDGTVRTTSNNAAGAYSIAGSSGSASSIIPENVSLIKFGNWTMLTASFATCTSGDTWDSGMSRILSKWTDDNSNPTTKTSVGVASTFSSGTFTFYPAEDGKAFTLYVIIK